MGQYSTSDFIGTRARFQRFSDAKLFNGWIQNITVASMTVRAPTDCMLHKGDRFMFHVASSHASARIVSDFCAVDGLEFIRSSNVQVNDESTAYLVDVPEVNFVFKVMSQLEYQPQTEEGRKMVDSWMINVQRSSGEAIKAFLSDMSEGGAGILTATPFMRGERVFLCLEASGRLVEVEAEIRYSVPSKIVPDMFKAGLKLGDFGRLEGAVWRNFLRAA